MGLFDKVKKILLENEEYEDEEVKEEPVAKKIALPKSEKREVEEVIEEDEIIDLVDEEEKEEEPVKEEKKVLMDFSDDDFVVKERRSRIDTSSYEEVKGRRSDKLKAEAPKKEIVQEEFNDYEYEEPVAVQEEVVELEQIYGKEKPVEEHGLYEGSVKKKTFTPTPVISPVYGILDKNYKKDDVVSKKEIRLSSAPAKKMDLDQVREKAYGDLTSDISQSMEEVERDLDDEIIDLSDDKLEYDLNNNDGPVVQKVTIGDAEEYFNDLGLEYNNDYKDNSTTKKENRRSERTEVIEEEIKEEEKEEKSVEQDEGIESNLFDLIESMYEEKE